MNKILSLTLLVAALGLLGLASTQAVGKTQSTSVKLRYQTPGDNYAQGAFTGKVRAPGRCKRDRKVRIKQIGGRNFGKAKTNRRGRFVIEGTAGKGRYVAATPKRKVKTSGGKKITCKAARSKRVQVKLVF